MDDLTAPEYLIRGGLTRAEIVARIMDPELLAAETEQRERESRNLVVLRAGE